MIYVFLALLLPVVVFRDPAAGLGMNKADSRRLECERIGVEEGRLRYPGIIDPAGKREKYLDRSVLVCTERLLRPGLRAPRDEAVLSSLQPLVAELTAGATELRPELAGRTWLVEAHYPNAPVAAKVSFATKNELVGRGLVVSDRTPVLSAGDVDALTHLGPQDAYAAACRRYLDNGSLGETDVLLAVVSRDPRETILHAGLCADGHWAWLK